MTDVYPIPGFLRRPPSAPRERPILFSAPMVRAILDGRKTQTRRVVKPQPVGNADVQFRVAAAVTLDGGKQLRCPYGKPGDRLWVREAWGIGYDDGNGGLSAIPWTHSIPKLDGTPVYRADFNDLPDEPRRPWRPSIHMPRWASRIDLEIVSVRVERLNDISDDDAKAEGCTLPAGVVEEASRTPHRVEFFKLWESINGPGSWASNPWVWCLTFSRVKP